MKRREFLGLIASAAIADDSKAPSPCGAQHAVLKPVGEIRSVDGVLRATITVEDENRAVWTSMQNTLDQQGFDTATCREHEQMRYFEGAPTGWNRVWAVEKGGAGPGSTLRAWVGDRGEGPEVCR